jgi:putative transposase
MIIRLIETEAFGYGYYKLTILLKRRFKLIVDDKKVYRLCKEMDILRPQRRKIIKHPRVIARNREITGSNQLWETDLKYGYIHGEDRFFYKLSYLDVFDRVIINSHIGLTCEAKDAVFALKSALNMRKPQEGKTLVIRSDNGPQFISNLFEEACNELKLEHERIPIKCPNKNAHIESYHRILEDDCYSQNIFESYAQAYEAVVENDYYYNNVRIHSAIGYLSPMEYCNGCKSGRIKPVTVKV